LLLSAFVGLDKHATSPPPAAIPKFWVSPLKKWLEGEWTIESSGQPPEGAAKQNRAKQRIASKRAKYVPAILTKVWSDAQ